MKNKILVFFAFIFTNFVVSAQDTIQQKDGNSLKVKVKEISKTEVKYLRFDNLDGPLYVFPLTDIDFIRYENGKIESYTHLRAETNSEKKPDEVFFEKDNTKNEIVKLDNQEQFIQGQGDAAVFYHKHKSAAGWTCATTILFSPIIGIIPAVATSLSPPAVYNLGVPNLERLKNPDYKRGYTGFAKKKKVPTATLR